MTHSGPISRNNRVRFGRTFLFLLHLIHPCNLPTFLSFVLPFQQVRRYPPKRITEIVSAQVAELRRKEVRRSPRSAGPVAGRVALRVCERPRIGIERRRDEGFLRRIVRTTGRHLSERFRKIGSGPPLC